MTAFSVLGSSCARLLHFKDNSYRGIIVAIAPHVPESKGNQLIQAIQDHFRNASRVLFKATRQHASFGQVTIVIPQNWKFVAIGKKAYYPYKEAHIRVEDPSPVHGNAPYTSQSGGCGHQGDFIHLTPQYLLDENSKVTYGDAGKVLTHEWAHFRYGVYDEYGYPGDPLYPKFYTDGNDAKVTSCSHPEVNINFYPNCVLDPNTGIYNDQCRYQVNSNSLSTSSLMSMHFLPQVDFFCDSTTHQKNAPTKQNVLCEGRSVWEVIRDHPDFVDYTPNNNWIEPPPVNFNIIQTKISPVYVVVDTSKEMQTSDPNWLEGNDFQDTDFALHQDRSTFVTQALKILINVIPEETLVGLTMFNDKVETGSFPLAPLTENQKSFFGETTTSQSSATYKAMEDAMNKARNDLRKENGGILLLITTGAEPPRDIDNRIIKLCENLQNDNVRVISILYQPYPSHKGTLWDYLTLLGDRTNGKNFVIHELTQGYNTKLDVLAQLTASMFSVSEDVNPEEENNLVVHSEGSYNTRIISGSIYVDKSMTRTTKMLMAMHKRGDIDLNSIKLLSPSGKTRIGYVNAEKRIESAFVFKLTDEPGQWNYSMEAQTTQPENPTVSIFVFSFPKDQNKTITVRSWTNAEITGVDITKSPLAIYAQVKRGSQPVVNAKVTAKIQRPLTLPNNYSTIFITLKDNGNGEPDITKNDGIYSRYFTEFNDKGHYLVSVSVEDNEDTILVDGTTGSSSILPKDQNVGYCCGSVVPIRVSSPSEHFSRISNAGVFTVKELPPPDYDMPPAKINDFQISNFDSVNGRVTLKWTAPGENYDEGRASKYEMVYSERRQDLQNNIFLSPENQVSNVQAPSSSGNTEYLMVNRSLDVQPKVVYYAVRAVDSSGTRGKFSNVVSVRYPAAITTTTTADITNTATTSTNGPGGTQIVGGGLSVLHIGIITASCVLFLLLLIIFLVCLRRRQRNRTLAAKNAATTKSSPERKDPQMFKNVESGGVKTSPNAENGKIYSVSQLVTPQFMSASDILNKQHQHQREIQKEQDYYDQDIKPPFPDDGQFYSTNYEHIDQPPNIIYQNPPVYDYYRNGGTNPFITAPPYGRTSLSDKPSSSYTSLSTNEPKRDNGYFTSYEETSDDSQNLRNQGEPPLSASKTSLARRIVAESQV